MHRDLREFLSTLRKENQVIEIEAAVDPYLELAEIHRRVIAEEGSALLFRKVKGSPFPVVTNLFGTRRRVDLAVGSKPEQIVAKAVKALPELMPPKVSGLWKAKEWLFPLAKIGLTTSRRQAPVLECVQREVDLTQLPVLTSWPDDGGPFVTLPLVYTEHPLTGEHNLGMYRIQIQNKAQTGIHWQIHKGGGFHYFEAEQLGRDLPVSMFLGGPPALILSAIAPLPEMLPELLLTSFLMGEKLEHVSIADHPHPLIANAEFAVLGKVPAHVRRPEGPFGDHYGYYSLTHDFPVFQVKAIYHRQDAIYPATVVGKPRQEDYFIGEYLQALLSPMFPLVMPGVKSLWTYAETGFHALAAAVVRESYQREALAHAFRILGEGQLTLTKFLMLTDVFLDLQDFKRVLETVLERFDPAKDLLLIPNTSMDTLDYTGRRFNHGSKGIMMGLGEKIRELSRAYAGDPLKGAERFAAFAPGCLLLQGPSYFSEPNWAQALLYEIAEQGEQAFAGWPLVILVDDLEGALKQTGFLWQVFTRFDPVQDLYCRTRVENVRLVYQGSVVIDARMKPDYPQEVEPSAETVNLVDRRWKEYGIH